MFLMRNVAYATSIALASSFLLFGCGGGGSGSDKVTTPITMLTNLEGFWPFEETGSATVAADASGKLRHLNATNITFASAGLAGNGSAITLGAGTPFLGKLAQEDHVDFKRLTISAWVYPTAYPAAANRAIVTAIARWNEDPSTLIGALTINADAQPQFFIFCSVGGSSSMFGSRWISAPSATTPLNTWTHLAGVVDGTKAYLYVNGEPAASIPCDGSLFQRPNVLIGGKLSTYGMTSYFAGRIDEVAVWSRGLDENEISSLHETGLNIP